MFVHILQEFWGYTQPDPSIFRNGQSSVQESARAIKETIKTERNFFKSKKNYMMLFGHDFYFIQAHEIFNKLEQALSILKEENNDFEIIYSNVSYYMQELKKEQIDFPNFEPVNDFFPYQAGPVNWWTGYFTSIPLYKRFINFFLNILQFILFYFIF